MHVLSGEKKNHYIDCVIKKEPLQPYNTMFILKNHYNHDFLLLPFVLKSTSLLIEKEPLQPRNTVLMLKWVVPR